jgi:hypothetical protein
MLWQEIKIVGVDSYNILVLQALYGYRTVRPPDLCSTSSFDAIFEYQDGIVYILKGDIHHLFSCENKFMKNVESSTCSEMQEECFYSAFQLSCEFSSLTGG